MSNKIIQRIRIDGKNWNDIISLPCVQRRKNISALARTPLWSSQRIWRDVLTMSWHVATSISNNNSNLPYSMSKNRRVVYAAAMPHH
jgi:hypothetical protein